MNRPLSKPVDKIAVCRRLYLVSSLLFLPWRLVGKADIPRVTCPFPTRTTITGWGERWNAELEHGWLWTRGTANRCIFTESHTSYVRAQYLSFARESPRWCRRRFVPGRRRRVSGSGADDIATNNESVTHVRPSVFTPAGARRRRR